MTHEDDSLELKRQEIECTRDEMGRKIESLADKLDPKKLMHDAKETVNETASNLMCQAKETAAEIIGKAQDSVKETTSEVVHNVEDATIGRMKRVVRKVSEPVSDLARGAKMNIPSVIKENPIPTAMIGVGLYLLLKDVWDKGGEMESGPYYGRRGTLYEKPELYGAPPRYETEEQPSLGSRASELASDVKEKAQSIASDVKDKAQALASDVRHKAESAYESVHNVACDMTRKSFALGSKVKYQAKLAGYELKDQWDQNPLLVGALAVGCGLVLGMLLPSTAAEHRLMGDARHQLKSSITESTGQLLEKAQSVASAAVDLAKDRLQEVAEETRDLVKEKAADEGLTASTTPRIEIPRIQPTGGL